MYGESDVHQTQRQTVEFRDSNPPDYLAMHPDNQVLDWNVEENQTTHDIYDFLKRPQLIKQFNWQDSDTINEDIMYISPLPDFIKTHNVYNKITGFRYFKGIADIHIIINAQPFQQGALLVWYIPQDFDAPRWSQKSRLPGKSGTHSFVINLADASTLNFSVPFVNPIIYEDLVAPYGGAQFGAGGTIGITIYSALQVGRCEVSVYGSFRNCSLAGPTSERPHNMFTPANFMIKPNGRVVKEEDDTDEEYVAQIGGETEAEGMVGSETITGKGPISRVARSVNEIANVVGSYFKPAMVIAKPVSWISAAIGQIATMFGWSKPISVQTTDIVRLKTNRYMANYNGIDTSDNLGLDADNQIVNASMFANNGVDEMMFDNIITIFNWGMELNWQTTQDVGAVLGTWRVHPMMFSSTYLRTVAGRGDTEIITSYLGFVAAFFKLWRGDIQLQFRAIKTNYHSGRLRFTWTPGRVLGTRYAEASTMGYSILWDIRTNHTTKTIIPWQSNMPWLPVPTWPNVASATQEANGTFEIAVVNPLRGPATVAQNINIVIEIAGMRGFAFAIPSDPSMAPIIDRDSIPWLATYDRPLPPNTQSETVCERNPDGREKCNVEYVAQVGDNSGLTDAQAYITQRVNNSHLLSGEMYTIGEAVVSFRQLIKRFRGYALVNGPFRTPNAYWRTKSDTSVLVVDPFNFIFGAPTQTINNSTGQTYVSAPQDFMELVGSIYGYYRGGMRLKAVYSQSYPNIRAKIIPSAIKLPFSRRDMEMDATGEVNVDQSVEGTVEVQVPFYSRTSHVCHKIVDTIADTPDVAFYIPGKLSSVTGQPSIYRAAADDFSFGFLTGVPCLQFVPSTAENYWPN